MKDMSEREYAAHSGLSRGGVQKARKNGRLVVHDDGSINAAASDVRRAEMTDPDQQRRSLGGDGLASGPGDTTSYIKARTALTVYAAQERQLAVQKKKGALVDRARAETLVFRLAREARDAAAEILQIEAGLKSRTQAIAERGYDAEQVDREIAAERKREAELGLDFRRPGSPAQAAGTTGGEEQGSETGPDEQDQRESDDSEDREPRTREEG